MRNRATAALLAGLAAIPALFSVGAGSAAECPAADVDRYEGLPPPKALVGNDIACTAWQGGLGNIESTINAALGVCGNKTDQPCRLIEFAATPKAAGTNAGPANDRPEKATPAKSPELFAAPPGCPGGDRVPVRLGGEPVRVNPNGLCAFTLWYRHCVYLRQAGEEATLGPYCPPEAELIEGAVRAKQFPPDVEWVWSAEQPFTAYVLLFVEGEGAADDEPAAGGPPAKGSAAWNRQCAEKYKSFEPGTGTYMGFDGERHQCRLP